MKNVFQQVKIIFCETQYYSIGSFCENEMNH